MSDETSDWEELTSGVPFITDLGFTPPIAVPTQAGASLQMQRYAVFLPIPDQPGRHQIVEVGGNVDQLQAKYEIPVDRVFRINAKTFGFLGAGSVQAATSGEAHD